MYCIGLTGNIGSGKSTAISFFNSLGASVIIADDIAKALTSPGQPAFKSITAHFGLKVLTKTGQLDRALLRKIIFETKQERLWLESLLHPLIREAIKMKAASSVGPYCVIEIPLLTNRLDYSYLDRILVILANPKTQLKRVIKRDLCTEEQVLTMIAAQPHEAMRRELADDILLNDNSLEEFHNNIRKLHIKYLQLASEKPS